MPVVNKQQQNGPPRTKGRSAVDRIAPVSKVDSGGLKLSLYGRSKTGKTRLISTFPKPVLIIGAEDGTRSIRNVPKVDFVLIERSDEIGPLLDRAAGLGYATVAVDTASALQDLILCEILGLTELPAQRSWGMASREQYGQCGLQMKTILRKVLELPLNVVITAHERNFNDEGGSDLIMPSVGSALSPSVAGWLNGASEYICQTFIRERSERKVTKVGTKEVATSMKTGEAEYCLRVGPHAVFMTGFRLPVGQTLPDVIVDPHYDKIAKIAYGK